MFCVHCGAQQEDGAKFCTSCGKPLDTEAPQAAPQPQEGPVAVEAPPAPKQVNPLVAKLKALPKWVYAAVVGGIAVIVAAILIVVNITSTINLNDFVTIEVDGYNGYGTAVISVDWEAMEAKYGDKVKFSKEVKEGMGAFGGFLDGISAFDGLRGSVDVSLDTDEGLSNGDEIHYTWDIDDELFQYVSCKLKYTEGTYTVEGLKEAETFDPFADLTVTFEGISTNGELNMEYAGEELNPYDFSCDTAYGLANGDTVTITLDDYLVEYCLLELGKIPSAMEKTYTVEGLSEYVTDFSAIPQEFLDSMKKEAEDAIYAYTAQEYGSDYTLGELTYGGYVLSAVSSATDFYGTLNDLCLIYTGTVTGKDEELPATTVYYPVEFTDILSTNGEMSYDELEGIRGYASLSGYWFSTDGYLNPVVCYDDISTYYGDNYNVTSGDGFEVYGGAEAVTALSQLSDGIRTVLQTAAQEEIQAEIADYAEEVTASELTFVGEYLLTAKGEADLEDRNYYVAVFSATVSHAEGDFEPAVVYYPVGFKGLFQMPDSSFSYIQLDELWGYDSFPDSYYSTEGYLDGTEMYADIITANRDSYNYEVSQGLQEFGK